MARFRHARDAGIVLLVLLVTQSCTGPVQEPSGPGLVTVKVLMLPYLGYSPFFIAAEEGYFAEQGLDVEFIRFTTSSKAFPLFLKGDIDVYPGVVSAGLMNAITRGAEVRIVAGKGHVGPPGDTYITLVARRELVESGKLARPAQMKGLRIAANPGHTTRYYMDMLLRKGALSLQDVHFKAMPIVMRQEALTNGAVDLASAGEPWTTRIVQSGAGVVWMPACEVVPGLQFAMMAYGRALLEENRGVGERFMVAYLKAARQYNEGKTDRNLDILAKYTELDREILKQAAWSRIRSDGRIDVESVLDFQKWAMAGGLQDRLVAEEDFWEPAFIERAGEVLDRESE